MVENIDANFSYHRGCYSAFTNSSMINQAQERCQNMDKEGVPLTSGIDIMEKVFKKGNQINTSAAAKSWNPHLLPCVCLVCIICKSEKSYFTESLSLLNYYFLQLLLFFNMCFIIYSYILSY
jgi:hypothetical protein